MNATEANLLKFLKKSSLFIIPIYQRNYSWVEAQCRQLWNDLLRAGRNEKINAHFIGSIVYVERALSSVTSQEALFSHRRAAAPHHQHAIDLCLG